jgi:hypothetical protein
MILTRYMLFRDIAKLIIWSGRNQKILNRDILLISFSYALAKAGK